MSFSSLSREIRDLIYRALLCPPDGVHLRPNYKRWMRRKLAAKTASHGTHGHDRTWNEADEHVDNPREESPTAIFCVNHQIGQEATEVYYRFNRFTFDSDVRSALKFLKGIHPSFRGRVRDIGFARRSTSAKNSDNRDFWDSASTFIARHMALRSVTIDVPYGCNYGIDRTKKARPAPDENWYWWPAVRLMTELLMAGKIGELRIAYCATLRLRAPEREEAQDIKARQSQHMGYLEILTCVSDLRYPRLQGEQDRGFEDFACAFNLYRRHKIHSHGTCGYDQETRRRQMLNFVVNREDNPIGDVGTVLVLTRPTAS